MSRGDTEAKNIFESEHVCGCHFVSGKPAAPWDKHNIDWVPTLNLGKKEYKESERKEQQQKAAGERAERAKEHRKRNIVQQEAEVAEKKIASQSKRRSCSKYSLLRGEHEYRS